MNKMQHIKIILLIILIAGAVGGIGNYFIIPIKIEGNTLLRSIVLGIIAAGVLPLFLKLISSNLLDLEAELFPYKKYITLASFCLLTGVFADVFLQGIYGKVFHVLEDKIEEQDNEIARVQFTNEALLNVISSNQIDTAEDNGSYLDFVRENYGLNTDQIKLYQSLTAEPVSSFRTEELTPIMQDQIKILMEKDLIKKKDLKDEVLISRSPIQLNN